MVSCGTFGLNLVSEQCGVHPSPNHENANQFAKKKENARTHNFLFLLNLHEEPDWERCAAMCSNLCQMFCFVKRPNFRLSRVFPFLNLGEMHQRDLVDYQPCE